MSLSASPPLPVILFSCGGFHGPECFDAVKQRLHAAGFEHVVVSNHPSLGANSAGKTLADDVEALHAQMAPHIIDAGREVIVIGHSYGGFPAFVATKGWSVAERASHIAASRGASVTNGASGSAGGGGHLALPNALSKHAFYNDMVPEQADYWADRLLPHSQDAFESPTTHTIADSQISIYYIITEQDQTFTPDIQKAMADSVPGCTVLRINAGHAAIVSQPDDFAELVIRIAKDIQNGKS
ncbi:Alpha/beta hydrolase fold-1 [Xylariales sp. PMI_506]|nr:Alpha/beta hydrolase fold-1 [Xylariales sp. PMI_506]